MGIDAVRRRCGAAAAAAAAAAAVHAHAVLPRLDSALERT
jgi:hypothetical protein